MTANTWTTRFGDKVLLDDRGRQVAVVIHRPWERRPWSAIVTRYGPPAPDYPSGAMHQRWQEEATRAAAIRWAEGEQP